MTKRFNSYCDNENIRIRIDDDINNKEVFHIYFAELDDALYCKSKLNSILDLLNELYEEKEMWKRECKRLKGLYYLENEKVELEDIIGLVKTDERTNSVELKKELYK